MNGYGSTGSFTVPGGDYYMYYSAAGLGNGTEVSNLTLNGTTVPTTLVTNGTLKAYKSTNKVTIGQDGSFTWTVYLD